MFKILKKMNIFVFFNVCRGFPIFCRLLPKRFFLDPRRLFADADFFNSDSTYPWIPKEGFSQDKTQNKGHVSQLHP
jgi:hypothetical protein